MGQDTVIGTDTVKDSILTKINGDLAEIFTAIESLAAGSGVLVSSNDTTVGYLNGKLVAGSGITFTEGNDGSNETLTIAINSSSMIFNAHSDADGDTIIQVEEAADEDKVRVDCGGSQCLVIDTSGCDVKSGGLLIAGNSAINGSRSATLTGLNLNAGAVTASAILDEDDMASNSAVALTTQQSQVSYIASGSVTFSNKNFSQDGTITITDTGNTTSEYPLEILFPNVPGNAYISLFYGREKTSKNCGILYWFNDAPDTDTNYIELTTQGNDGIRVDAIGNVGVGATSNGDKFYVSGTSEITDTLTLSKGSGTGLVVTSNVDFNGNQDLAGTLDIGSGTTRRVAPKGTYVDNANGNPNVSDTGFNYVNEIAEDAWESVGPTGGGADNIWTALDSVPDDAHWIEVSYSGYGNNGSGGNFGSYYVYARKNGSSEAKGAANLVAQGNGYIDASNNAHDPLVPLVLKIPISSGKFDLYWENTNYGAVAGTMYLIGYDLNP